ncbi:MAG: guanylate kinase [Blastocatellia bacterium]|jgi:guanylate kinase|nr:guanylate kinase [Blastocatellia bacterium]
MSNEKNRSRRLGNLIVITAPSGAGKSTLVKRLRETVSEVDFSVSYTTRLARVGEVHGKDYFFISMEEFQSMRESEEFLEWAQVYTNFYATGKDAVSAALHQGKDILLDIDTQGACQIKKLMPDAVLIFILPPSFDELAERLKSRNLDKPEVIERRLAAAAAEVAHYTEFNYVVINDDLESATALLASIVIAERQRPNRLKEQLNEIVNSFQRR